MVLRDNGGRGRSSWTSRRGEEGLEGTRRDVEATGGQAVTVRTDVSDADQVDAAAARSRMIYR